MSEELNQQQHGAPPAPQDAQNGESPRPLTEPMRILEALLFASEEVVPLARLKSIIPGEPDARALRKLVDQINHALQEQRHPFEIVEVANGYQFKTIPYYSPWVRQLLREKAAKKLSIQALEALAIIAYKQPITKAEIEAIRGVISDGAMKTLLERRMVTIGGRSDKPGRPLLYETTKEFLVYFGQKNLGDLPKIEEFEAMARERMGDLEAEMLRMQQETVGPGDEDAEALAPDEPSAEETQEIAVDEGDTVALTPTDPGGAPAGSSDLPAHEDAAPPGAPPPGGG